MCPDCVIVGSLNVQRLLALKGVDPLHINLEWPLKFKKRDLFRNQLAINTFDPVKNCRVVVKLGQRFLSFLEPFFEVGAVLGASVVWSKQNREGGKQGQKDSSHAAKVIQNPTLFPTAW